MFKDAEQGNRANLGGLWNASWGFLGYFGPERMTSHSKPKKQRQAKPRKRHKLSLRGHK